MAIWGTPAPFPSRKSRKEALLSKPFLDIRKSWVMCDDLEGVMEINTFQVSREIWLSPALCVL